MTVSLKSKTSALLFFVLALCIFISVGDALSDGEFAGGLGTAESPYQIATCAQLQSAGSYLDSNFLLTAEIDCTADTGTEGGALWNGGLGFAPIGSSTVAFTGNFDGDNHIITGLFINRPSESYVGLFGQVSSTISNLILSNVDITGYGGVGALIGGSLQTTSVENVHSSGNVVAIDAGAGGLIGSMLNNSIIENSYSSATVSSTEAVGGLVGEATTVSSSYATGNVVGGITVGGLAGEVTNIIFNSYATGQVTVGSKGGGLVGMITTGGSVFQSYATGDVVGLSGNNMGGLIGYCQYGSVSTSFAYGDVTGSVRVGGLIGNSGGCHTVNIYATGNVVGSNQVGGLIGWEWGGPTSVENAYSTGNVSGTNNVGGLIGSVDSQDVNYSFSVSAVPAYDNVNYIGGLFGTSDLIEGTVGNYWYNSNTNGVGNSASATSSGEWELVASASVFKGTSTTAPLDQWSFSGENQVWVATAGRYPTLYAIAADDVSPITYTLTYSAGTGGSLTGTASQTVDYGSDGSAVTAVADSGYQFVNWNDDSTANPRTDTNITQNLSVSAVFEATPSSGSSGGIIIPSGPVVNIPPYLLAGNIISDVQNGYQMAISADPFFTMVGWESYQKSVFNNYSTDTLYIKYRTSAGGVSQVFILTVPNNNILGTHINETIATSSITPPPDITDAEVVIDAPLSEIEIVVSQLPPPDYFTFLNDLKPTMINEEVKELQKYLNTNGFVLSKVGPGSPGQETDKFGRLTWIALLKFQRAHKIYTENGSLGKVTRNYINSDLSLKNIGKQNILANYSFNQDLKPSTVNADVKKLQRYLNNNGFPIATVGPGSPGYETEKFGSFTWFSLLRFQKANHIVPANGTFNSATREYVNSKLF